MGLGIFLNIVIMAIWLYVGMLSFAYYTTSVKNHYRYRTLYTISILNFFISILAIYYLTTGNDQFQATRWLLFSIFELNLLSFVMRNVKIKRTYELILVSFFTLLVVISYTYWWLGFNLMIAGILTFLACKSQEEITRKFFSISMILYGMTSVVPVIFGFTTNASLFMGVIFSLSFAIGSHKLYMKEKIDDELKKMFNFEKKD